MTDSTEYRLAQQLRTRCSICSDSVTHRKVSCRPAKLASAASSVVAEERTATGDPPARRRTSAAYAAEISSSTSGGNAFGFNASRAAPRSRRVTAARSSAVQRLDARAQRALRSSAVDEPLECPGRDHESRRHGDAGPLQLAEAPALAAHLRPVVQADIGEPTDDLRRCHR